MTDPAPLVSIVIPAYNHAGYLAQAVNSVLAQDYPRIELIVIDDGSTDATPQILRSYEGRAEIIRQENCGQAATLNRGWKMAQGEFLGYLSADDVLEPAAVRAAVKALASHPRAVVAYPDFQLLDPHSAVIRTVRASDFRYSDMLLRLECPPGPGALFRRSAFAAAGGWNPEYRQMPDLDFWLRIGLMGDFIHIARVLAGFRLHPRSQTYAAASEERADEPVRIVSSVFQSGRVPGELAPLRDHALSNAYIASAQLHLRAGRPRAAWGRIRRAAALHPRSLFTVRSARALVNALVNRAGHRLLWSVRHALRPSTRADT